MREVLKRTSVGSLVHQRRLSRATSKKDTAHRPWGDPQELACLGDFDENHILQEALLAHKSRFAPASYDDIRAIKEELRRAKETADAALRIAEALIAKETERERRANEEVQRSEAIFAAILGPEAPRSDELTREELAALFPSSFLARLGSGDD